MLPVLFSYYKILNYDDEFSSFIISPEQPAKIVNFSVYIHNLEPRILYFTTLNNINTYFGSYTKSHYFQVSKPYTLTMEQMYE